MSDQMPAELDRLLGGMLKRLAVLEGTAGKIPAVPITRASGQFNLPEVSASNPPSGTVVIYSEDGHLRIREDDGDVIEIPAANVTNWGGAASSSIGGTPTASDYNTLRNDVNNVGTTLNNLLNSLRNAGIIG